MLESLSEFLAPPRVLAILAFLRGAFCAAAVALALRACFHFAPYRVGHRVRLMLFPLLFCAAALAILAAQARWQVFGFTDRRFVAYMERHNARPDNAAHHLVRGTVLDRAGRPLAYTEADGSGRRVYPYEAAAAHVVGFRHPSEGLNGIEGAADDLLSGWRELATAQDVREAGRTAFEGAERHIGTNLTLTIDAQLQLQAAVDEDGGGRAPHRVIRDGFRLLALGVLETLVMLLAEFHGIHLRIGHRAIKDEPAAETRHQERHAQMTHEELAVEGELFHDLFNALR